MPLKGEQDNPIIVGICDDIIEHLNDIKKLVIQFFAEHELAVIVRCYTAAKQLMGSKIDELDILFLDIQLGEDSGLDIGMEIRKENSHYLLILISSFGQYTHLGYEISAFRYIPKEERASLVGKYLDDAMHQLNIFRTKMGMTFSKIGYYEFYIHRLAIIESSGYQLTFHFVGNDRTKASLWNKKLDDMEAQSDLKTFIRIQQSFLVNPSYIQSVDGLSLYLIDDIAHFSKGFPLKISEKLLDDVMAKYNRIRGEI